MVCPPFWTQSPGMRIDEQPPARTDLTDKPAITPIELADESAVLRILRRHMRLGSDSALPPQGYLTWLAKAAAVAGIPSPMLGWKLTHQQEIRGVLLVTPFRNVDGAGRPFHDLVGHNFFVDEDSGECRASVFSSDC